MAQFDIWQFDQETQLVALAGALCLMACLVSLVLMIQARVGGVYRPRMALIAALVFGAGLSATLFAFMLAYRPGIALRYQLAATLLSVAAAMTIGWFALGVILHLRAAHAAIAAGRYPVAGAIRHAAEFDRLGDVVSQAMAAWHGRRKCRAFAGAVLLALAICGLDFVAVRDTRPAAETAVERPASTSDAAAMQPRGPSRLSDRERAVRMAAKFVATARDPVGPREARGLDIAALATEIANAQKIDPLLVLAVIATESGFQSDAVSAGNAQGLMQLMPDTARRFGARNPLNPAENIRAGTSYLRWLLAHFEGDLSLALAAYNAGEGAVIHYGGVPPFPETHAYLRKIRTLYPAEHHPIDQLAVR
jgi:NO-binding membrane sensor protein with MHYT domain